MCFQSGHSQHPTGFLFNSTQPLPAAELEPFISLKLEYIEDVKLVVIVLVLLLCYILHGLFAEHLITGDNHINLQLMLQ